jgi:hypothetical protein
MDLEKKSAEKLRPEDVDQATGDVGEVLNASGHKQELERNFSLLSICAIGITTGNVWAALGGSIVRDFFSLFPTKWIGYKILTVLRLSRFTMVARQVLFMNSSLWRAVTL